MVVSKGNLRDTSIFSEGPENTSSAKEEQMKIKDKA